MSPSRAQIRTYRPPRARREVAFAILGVLSVLVVTAVLIWVFAPADETETIPTDLTIPTDVSVPDTSVTTTGVPATTATSAPG